MRELAAEKKIGVSRREREGVQGAAANWKP